MKSQTVKLPAFMASALVNGDTSGLTCSCGAEERALYHGAPEDPHIGDCDFRWLAAAIAYAAPGEIVSAEGEAYFSRTCDLPGWRLGADMLDYVVLYPNTQRD